MVRIGARPQPRYESRCLKIGVLLREETQVDPLGHRAQSSCIRV